MKTKSIVITILIAAIIISSAIIFAGVSNSPKKSPSQITSNISMVDGKQVITINVKGGYSPKIIVAKADIPTVLKMETQNTFDCSSALTIPSLGYRNNLPSSGETIIDVPAQKAGTNIRGICAMGMYNFSINFE